MKTVFTLSKLRQAACALALLSCAAYATANVNYHVAIDTTKLSGSGWLDLQFNPGQAGAAAAQATLSHFSGTVSAGQTPFISGAVTGTLPGNVTFVNSSPYNDLFQAIDFGKIISFDLTFSGAFETTLGSAGSIFGVGLFDLDQVTPIGGSNPDTGILFSFNLAEITKPGEVPVITPVVNDKNVVSSNAIPEPSHYLLLLTAMAAMLTVFERKQNK